MKLAVSTLLAAAFLSTGVISCANRPCQDLRRPELANQQAGPPANIGLPVAGAPVVSSNKGGAVKLKESLISAPERESTILIFKADGSLQCGAAKGMSLTEMEKQLSGIKIYSREKRSDGLMHIQVCGSPTGIINLYEVPESALKEAEARGFRRFEAR